jgi:Cu(I)/Ag(I) efflux system membrane fusion protein
MGGAMQLPAQLKGQLMQVLESAEEIEDAVEAAELDQIRTGFETLGKRVGEIDPNALPGDMGDQLGEFVMLLRNDAVEGGDIQSLKQADRVAMVTKRHAERMREMFGLYHAGHPMVEKPLEVPDSFRQDLSRLLKPYLEISRTLAADDAAAAMDSVETLHQVVSSLSGQSLEGKASQRWQAEQKSLSKITARLAKATDLESMRSAFALLSDQLLTLQRSFGLAGADRLFELHCPMAFDGRGASWIQTDDTVRNPYYGESMLRCADRVESLGVRSEE